MSSISLILIIVIIFVYESVAFQVAKLPSRHVSWMARNRYPSHSSSSMLADSLSPDTISALGDVTSLETPDSLINTQAIEGKSRSLEESYPSINSIRN